MRVGLIQDGCLGLRLGNLDLIFHFPDVCEEAELCCERCEDFLMAVCPGEGLRGREVIEKCMNGKAECGDFGIIGDKPRGKLH